ncbi:MAG: hypothetical protein OEN21_15050 [Myxococcales bacterium]|nr:hypothetical protein [Myxococcales bacterium]
MREPTAEEEDDPEDPVDDSVDELEPVGPGFMSEDGAAKKLQWALNEDGSRYFRIELWLQVWTRALQLNPGTTILDDPSTPEAENQDAWYGDVGIRRARIRMFGEIFPRVLVLLHFGINNQTFRRDVGSGFKQQLFFHDLWAEVAAVREHLYIGGGLIYWNGISRMTNASTITLMSLDAPVSNWPTIEETDQFARQLGVYAKGKAGLFDYRLSATRPFVPVVGPPTTTGNYNVGANTWAFAGYFQLQFWDIESDVLPYTTGTYIGEKRVMNVGAGFYTQPKGIAYLGDGGELRERANSIASADFFVDLPLKAKNGGALTAYAVYYWWDFGPNNLRNIGVMNPGDIGSGTSLNGRGNDYPMLGTGNTGYGQFGWLMPWKVKTIQFQPYILSQMSKFDALNDTMFQFGVGVNMFVYGHNAKVTLEYRNRPIFNLDGNVESRKGNALVLQMHLYI